MSDTTTEIPVVEWKLRWTARRAELVGEVWREGDAYAWGVSTEDGTLALRGAEPDLAAACKAASDALLCRSHVAT